MKPLKAPKKEKKDMDEDEVAFKAKQQAGTISSGDSLSANADPCLPRRQSSQGNGR